MIDLEIGGVYNRKEVHQVAKDAGLPSGSETAGIVTVGSDLTIFWNPFRRFYANRWIERPRVFQYSGQGSVGPMKMVSGNAALLQALDTKRSVRLFYKLERTGSRWKYVGDYLVTEVVDGISEDDNGNLRSDYRFVFEGISEPTRTSYGLPSPEPKEPRSYPEDELWALVEKARETTGGRRTRGDLMHPQKRLANPAISAYARQRAVQFGGTCELCEYDPGWRTSKGAIHLQVHHLHPDIDLVDWVAAVCGTCHDRLHHSTDRHESTKKLRERIVERQTSRGRPIVDGRDILLPKT